MNLNYIKVALAAIIIGVTAFCQAEELPNLNKLQGLYKYSFPNRLMGGTKYTSENRFLLMPLSPDTAYFDLHLDWANGHSCDLFGIAEVKSKRMLIYSEPSIYGKTCIFTIHIDTIATANTFSA